MASCKCLQTFEVENFTISSFKIVIQSLYGAIFWDFLALPASPLFRSLAVRPWLGREIGLVTTPDSVQLRWRRWRSTYPGAWWQWGHGGLGAAAAPPISHASVLPFLPQFLLPLLIEKVDSEILSAKLDSLQTLVSDFSLLRTQLSLDNLAVLQDYGLILREPGSCSLGLRRGIPRVLACRLSYCPQLRFVVFCSNRVAAEERLTRAPCSCLFSSVGTSSCFSVIWVGWLWNPAGFTPESCLFQVPLCWGGCTSQEVWEYRLLLTSAFPGRMLAVLCMDRKN